MAYEQRDNSGSLFANERKEKDAHPDRQGSAMIDGREYWVSGWLKQDRNGKPWLSLAFKPKDAATKPAPASARKPAAATSARRSQRDDLDDEIPF